MNSFVEVKECRVCKSTQLKKHHQIYWNDSERIFKSNFENIPRVSLYKCLKCGYAFVNPQIANDVIENYYFKLNSTFYDNGIDIPYDFIYKKNKKLAQYVKEIKNGGNILEVGCGMGFMLNEFDRRNWNLYGIEPSIYASGYAVKNFGLNVTHGYLKPDSFTDGFFDVIMLFDVIEHVYEPTELMQNVYRILKKEGLIVISTGNIESLNARIARGYWEYLKTWEHISLFSPKSIHVLLNNVGFSSVNVHKVSHHGGLIENIIVLIKCHFKNLLKIIIRPIREYEFHFPLFMDHLIVTASKCDI
jgi:2-polyprenyl-3-methyl-5-hydroxy-6-metoxy-1,4-benzoquinol methylase